MDRFKKLINQFCMIPINENTSFAINPEMNAADANMILAYCYADHDAGLTLEILTPIKTENGQMGIPQDIPGKRTFIRYKDVVMEETFIIPDKDGRLADRFADKLGVLKKYEVSEEIAQTREMTQLDGCRDDFCIDDVSVVMVKEGLELEYGTVRIEGYNETIDAFYGILLKEPEQDFGYHAGEFISFGCEKINDAYFCVSGMDQDKTLTEESLADGSMLKQAISAYYEKPELDEYVRILEILRNSDVWIPCNAVMEEADEAAFKAMVDQAGEDPSSLLEKEFTNEAPIYLKPDILKKGEDLYFPVFSDVDAMGEYGEHFSKIQKSFMEAVKMAEHHEGGLQGIVVNAFTRPCEIPAKYFEVVKKMKGRI